jgi:phage-related protein
MPRDIFQDIGHELGVFFGTNDDNRGHGTIDNIFKGIGDTVSDIFHFPQEIIQTASGSVTSVVDSVGSGASQIIDTTGTAISTGAQGIGTGVQSIGEGLTLPLLIGAGGLAMFLLLRN